MDKEKNNPFFKYLHLICIGFFIGVCFGTIMVLVNTQDRYVFELTISAVLCSVLLCVLVLKYDFNLVFGLSLGLGMGLMGGMYFLKTTNFTDACTAFAMVFLAFFVNYALLKLVRHIIRLIIYRYKEKITKPTDWE